MNDLVKKVTIPNGRFLFWVIEKTMLRQEFNRSLNEGFEQIKGEK